MTAERCAGPLARCPVHAPSRILAERDVKRGVVDLLRAAGYWVARIQSGRLKVRGGFMVCAPEGTADLLALRPGEAPLWVECKRAGRDITQPEQRAAQDRFRALVERCGHRYVRAASVEAVRGAIEAPAR